MKKNISLLIVFALSLTIVGGCAKNSIEKTSLNLRLQRVPQAQFAGYIVAKEKGFYEQVGLDVSLFPAGPDVKPQVTVANGTDDIGIGVPNQVISAQSQNVPLVVLAQLFQESPNKYIIKSKNKIQDLKELRNKKVGLWMGGDEAEFISMLKSADMSLTDVQVIPQYFSISPFLEDEYMVSQVTVYHELYEVKRHLMSGESLQILSPKDYNSAIPGDMVFTTQQMIDNNPSTLTKFLSASLRGWQYSCHNKEDTLNILLKNNQELEKEEQIAQLEEVCKLLAGGFAKEKGIGYINIADYENTQNIMKKSAQITELIDINKVINTSIWESVDPKFKQLD